MATSFEHESNSEEIGSVWRFYNDLHYKSEYRNDLLLSLHRLSEVAYGQYISDDEARTLLSFEGEVSDDEIERAIIYGLQAAEWLEKESDSETLEADYKKIFALIFLIAEEHSDKCVTVDYLQEPSCDVAEVCPRRAVEAFATGSVLKPNFDDLEYVFDGPEARVERFKARLRALTSANPDRSVLYEQHLKAYDRRFNDWLTSLPSNQPEV